MHYFPKLVSVNCLSLDAWEEHRFFKSKFLYFISDVQMYMYLVFSNSVIRNEIFLSCSYFNFSSFLKRSDPMFFNVA